MNSALNCRLKELFGGSVSSEWVASMARERYANGPGHTIHRKNMKAVGMMISDTKNKMDNKSEIVIIVFASGKRKQEDDSTSDSQSKSATTLHNEVGPGGPLVRHRMYAVCVHAAHWIFLFHSTPDPYTSFGQPFSL
jgi:hypothetical protein